MKEGSFDKIDDSNIEKKQISSSTNKNSWVWGTVSLVGSLVSWIISPLTLCGGGGLNFIPVYILTIISIVLGIVAIAKKSGRGMGITAVVLGALLLSQLILWTRVVLMWDGYI